jgi:hypothetical protein
MKAFVVILQPRGTDSFGSGFRIVLIDDVARHVLLPERKTSGDAYRPKPD